MYLLGLELINTNFKQIILTNNIHMHVLLNMNDKLFLLVHLLLLTFNTELLVTKEKLVY